MSCYNDVVMKGKGFAGRCLDHPEGHSLRATNDDAAAVRRGTVTSMFMLAIRGANARLIYRHGSKSLSVRIDTEICAYIVYRGTLDCV